MASEDANKMALATDTGLVSNESDDLHQTRTAQSHVDENAQRGVQDVEAVTLSWTKTSLMLVFLK